MIRAAMRACLRCWKLRLFTRSKHGVSAGLMIVGVDICETWICTTCAKELPGEGVDWVSEAVELGQ